MKKTGKILLLCLLLSAMVLALAACDGGNELLGTWRSNTWTNPQSGTVIYLELVFDEETVHKTAYNSTDGTVIVEDFGPYTKNGAKITVTYEGEGDDTRTCYDCVGATLKNGNYTFEKVQ